MIDGGITRRKGRRTARGVFFNELEGADGGVVELLSAEDSYVLVLTRRAVATGSSPCEATYNALFVRLSH